MKTRFLSCTMIAMALTGAPQLVLAQPTVNGNRIDWPDDGWYQVQDASTYAQLCGGTRFCDVPAGEYIVINHTSAERFPGVIVTGDAGGSDGISVEGNRIAWPDDGWYQVQDAATYAQLCGGTRFCDVPAGEYIVINHTSAERFPGVIVTGDTGTPNGISVDGNRIAWPDDGWYQVQDAATYAELCGGTRFCDVPAGDYIVINHTSGTRTIVVVEDGEPAGDFINAGNALALWADVAGVINDERLDEYFATLAEALKFQGQQFFLSNTVDDIVFSEGITFDPPYRFETGDDNFVDLTQGSVYTCAAGGRLVNVSDGLNNDAEFDDCAVGAAVYNGTVGMRNLVRGAISRQPYLAFERVGSDGRVQRIDGEHFGGNESFVFTNRSFGWIDLNYTDSSDGYEVSDYTFTRTEESSTGSASNSISGSASVSGPFTDDVPLDIAVDLSFAGTDSDDASFEWQTGEVGITADDGSAMTVTPSPGDAFVITLDNGESIGPLPWSGEYELERR